MCDRRPTGEGTAPRPRWVLLYLLALSTSAAAGAVSTIAGPGRAILGLAVGVTAAFAAFRWIAANRVALDELEWCACASATVQVRVIAPHAASVTPAEPPPDRPLVEARDDRLATLAR
jgi:hypothetical protein